MSRKSDALGTGAIAFSPLVDILLWSFRVAMTGKESKETRRCAEVEK